tara:strand:- start:285 stop:596 length:312 start_codon:yes stop_codon:yes gene_type:complete
MGTNESKKTDAKKEIVRNLINFSLSCTDIIIIKNKDIETKKRCFLKKKYDSLFIFSATTYDVEVKEKNNPSKKRNVNKNKICLSTFLHHLAILPVFSLRKLNI